MRFSSDGIIPSPACGGGLGSGPTPPCRLAARAPLPNPPPQAGEGERSCAARDHAFFATGTGVPAILRLTEPRCTRLVKNNVFQSSPPKPRLVVAGCP